MSKKCADTHTKDDYCNPPPTLGLTSTHYYNLLVEQSRLTLNKSPSLMLHTINNSTEAIMHKVTEA